MVRLEELQRAFGGTIRARWDRRWLDTQIGGLRVWIICREHAGRRRYELAVFREDAREIDPFFDIERITDWQHAPDTLPRLSYGFVFAGCWSGVLLATYPGEPRLEDLVSTLWELCRWAREPWAPLPPSAEHPPRGEKKKRERSRRVALVAVFVAIIWLLRRLLG